MAKPVVFDPTKPFSWSYSKLKNYEVCPKRMFHTDVLRQYTDDSEALRYGNAVHDALANYISNGKPPPKGYEGLAQFGEPYRRMRDAGCIVEVEQQLAINAQFKPVEWFAKDAWFRTKIDVMVRRGPVALLIDWKTGKMTDDSPQLRLSAITAMVHHPEIQRAKSKFVWLKVEDETEEDLDRKDVLATWTAIAPRVNQLHLSMTNPNPEAGFPPKPGPFCRKYCAVKVCPHNG